VFTAHSEPKLKYYMSHSFDAQFATLFRKWEFSCREKKTRSGPRKFEETKKGKELAKKGPNVKSESKKPRAEEEQESSTANGDSSATANGANGTVSDETKRKIQEEARKKLAERMKGKGTPKSSPIKDQEDDEEGRSSGKKKSKKVLRDWGASDKVDSKTMKNLDASAGRNENGEAAVRTDLLEGSFADSDEDFSGAVDNFDSDDEEEEEETKVQKGFFSKLGGKIQNWTGNKTLEEDDLDPVLEGIRESLMAKNVAAEITQRLCESVKSTLVGTKTKSFTSVRATVREAIASSVKKILTPKHSVDILKAALKQKEAGKPYVVVFIGVNGVGKSTNLAKVGHYLKTMGRLSIMLAACDNFRAGAVEQLKTHGRNLDVPVFDKGYKSDPAVIASEAIREAKNTKTDVVLIDTAGRMQDNEPLMRALAKLVSVNNPNLVLFIGEALVGNDGVDQLSKFNQSLIDLSQSREPRTIDGIILSKFDTVDDKVGAALSMVYTTGRPIVFVGTGQKYTNLRKLNVKTVTNALLS